MFIYPVDLPLWKAKSRISKYIKIPQFLFINILIKSWAFSPGFWEKSSFSFKSLEFHRGLHYCIYSLHHIPGNAELLIMPIVASFPWSLSFLHTPLDAIPFLFLSCVFKIMMHNLCVYPVVKAMTPCPGAVVGKWEPTFNKQREQSLRKYRQTTKQSKWQQQGRLPIESWSSKNVENSSISLKLPTP